MIRLLFFIGLSMLMACSGEEDQRLTDTLIVEGYLFVGKTPALKISKILSRNGDASPLNPDDLAVFINNGGLLHELHEIEPGIYGTANFLVSAFADYDLLIHYNGKEIGASTRAPAKPENFTMSRSTMEIQPVTNAPITKIPLPIDLTWTNTGGAYHLAIIENIETDPEPINQSGTATQTLPIRTQPTTSTTQVLRAIQFRHYGMHRVILFHVSPEYAALYANTGTTTQNLTTTPSNIVNGLGIFTAMNSDTLYLQVKKP